MFDGAPLSDWYEADRRTSSEEEKRGRERRRRT